MKFSSFLAKTAVVGLIAMPFSPAVASTIGSSLGGSLGDTLNSAFNTKVSCSVEATTKLVGLTQNEITYKLKYTSNVEKLNTSYNVQAGSPANFLHQKGGAFSMAKATAYVPLTPPNTSEMKFTYAIAGNPSVEIQANVNGIRCTSKTLTTLQPAANQINSNIVNSNPKPQLNGGAVNSQVALPQVAPAQIQSHTCQILSEAMLLDKDSLQIGAGIKFDTLVKGNYPYSVRGYLSSNPNVIKEYSGMYAAGSSNTGVILSKDGKGFMFTFDAKTSADKYVVSATLGNIDCKMVYFASPVVDQPAVVVPPAQNNGGNVQVNNNGGVLAPSQNGAGVSGSGSSNGSVAGQAGGQGAVVTPVGLEASEQAEASDLNLVNQATVSGDSSSDDEQAPSVVSAEEENGDVQQDNSDYVVYGLLGAIFLSIVTYIVMKYRGML